MRKFGPYSRPKSLAKLDGRTREALLMRHTRAALIEHVGGSPSQTQLLLIERATQLTLRIATMDRRFSESRVQTEHDSRTYLAWSAALVRALRELGMQPAAVKPPTIAEVLARPKPRPDP